MIKLSLVKYSLQNIYKRRARSWLTVISVFIGITAITALISFGYGISFYVSDFSTKMGSDKLIVMAKGISSSFSGNIRLSKGDLETIKKVNGVEEVAGIYTLSAEVESNRQKKYSFMIAVNFKEHRELMNELMTVGLVQGEQLGGTEKTKVILGYNYLVPNRIFSKPLKLGEKIKINGKELDVLGFYSEIGNPSDDSQIYITETAAEEIFGANNYNEIFIRASPGANMQDLAETITRELRKYRGQERGAEDFFVQTFEQLLATFSVVLNVIIAIVLLIALISVVVAGVNIMNTMYASILERTSEIGIFKAVGAKNQDILLIFTVESGILSLFGGVIGLLLGFIIAKTAGVLIAYTGYAMLKPFFSWQLAFSILAFAFLVGLIAGLVPARHASRLKPVEALRYE